MLRRRLDGGIVGSARYSINRSGHQTGGRTLVPGQPARWCVHVGKVTEIRPRSKQTTSGRWPALRTPFPGHRSSQRGRSWVRQMAAGTICGLDPQIGGKITHRWTSSSATPTCSGWRRPTAPHTQAVTSQPTFHMHPRTLRNTGVLPVSLPTTEITSGLLGVSRVGVGSTERYQDPTRSSVSPECGVDPTRDDTRRGKCSSAPS